MSHFLVLKSLVEYIVKTLVESPDLVQINQTDRDGQAVIVISVNKSDIGRVIGKDGQTIKAIRSLVFAVKNDDSVSDIIIDDNE